MTLAMSLKSGIKKRKEKKRRKKIVWFFFFRLFVCLKFQYAASVCLFDWYSTDWQAGYLFSFFCRSASCLPVCLSFWLSIRVSVYRCVSSVTLRDLWHLRIDVSTLILFFVWPQTALGIIKKIMVYNHIVRGNDLHFHLASKSY